MARSLEKRLERLLESVAGKAFSGRLHPSEIAGKLAREADLARFHHETGPATANSYTLLLNPADLVHRPETLERLLAAEVDSHAAEEGLRLEGPLIVTVNQSEDVSMGSFVCHVEVVPGDPMPWARLVADSASLPVGHNRVLIGRSPKADVVLAHDDISRRHALLWRQGGKVWICDLASANGTFVDGLPVGVDPAELAHGSMLSFSVHRYRFLEI